MPPGIYKHKPQQGFQKGGTVGIWIFNEYRNKKISMKSNEIALMLFFLGFKYHNSTGICGRTTHGYGKLDNYGYWEYPLYFKESK